MQQQYASANFARYGEAAARKAGGTPVMRRVHRRPAPVGRVIALVLGHGIAIYQFHDGLAIFYKRKIELSLPFPCHVHDYHRTTVLSL
jgi:hypothetical protein